ncbi:MAG: tryptophan 7-halogenase [Alphaproteobacteria bacterium]|nr:tryptophan 7-halogenase [Alphaproteobacteria bacterium]
MTRDIVIVGGGTAGWMAAAMLSRFLERGWRITLVESEEIGTVGVGEATIPPIRAFNSSLGLDEDEFVRATKATFKLGIEFVGWRGDGHRYMHAFGPVGRELGIVSFHHYWRRARALGLAQELGAYSFNAVAAQQDRFGRTLPAGTSLAAPPYAFHFDAGLYAAFLRRYAEARGVRRVEGKVVEAARGDSGIASVRLESGESVAGELFIDCSGFRGLLIEQALGAGFEDWSHWLPCDRAMAMPCAHSGGFTPYTRATARSAGWQWRIPLQHRIGNGYVYSSAHLSDDEAAAALLANLDGEPLGDPRALRFAAGRRRSAWVGNCVALGLAAGFLEPLESTSIHLVQSGLVRLLQLLPSPSGIGAAEVAEYNRQTRFEWERIRDFLILHYKATDRPEPLWRAAAAMEIPPSLADRISLFREAGRVFREGEELFTENGWVQVLIGQGIVPESWHPLAELLSEDELGGFLATVKRQIDHHSAAWPLHRDIVARIAGSPA